MKIRTLVVSRYPMFKEGLKKVLGPSFEVTSHFCEISELFKTRADAELIIVDEKSSEDLSLLIRKKPKLAILRLSLETNTGHLYECANGTRNKVLSEAVQSLPLELQVLKVNKDLRSLK